MTAYLRIVAIAAGLGSWVLVLVGAGAGQSSYARDNHHAARMATAANPDPCPAVTSSFGVASTGVAVGAPCGQPAKDELKK